MNRLALAFGLSLFFRLYSTICGYVSYGKSRFAEKSKERTFPLRLEIPQKHGISHFSHSSDDDDGKVGRQKQNS
jgi:hypothetical protein